MRASDMMSKEMETAIVNLVNSDQHHDHDVYLEEYQKVILYIYNENIFKNILDSGKFVDIGSVYDFPEQLPQPEYINGFDMVANFDMFQKIAVSEKFNAVVFYSVGRYEINCAFLIENDYLKKFSKKTKEILQQDSRANMFKDIKFKCKKREYIEISDATGDEMKPADVIKKKVEKEKLVFDPDSTIVEVMNDIISFFTEKTRKLYESLSIAYKRGIILHGDPGNGKSTMIRELIRSVPDIAKIVINPNVSNVTKILAALMKSLNGKKAIIIIEDIDSLITSSNRSEFLNILDGVEVKSGVYFIATTNYPERIDPAFKNRSGRFDRIFKIDNPTETMRFRFFESRKVNKITDGYQIYRDKETPVVGDDVVKLFVKYSNDLPMASLKELITSTAYSLASNEGMSVEEALENAYQTLTNSRAEHAEFVEPEDDDDMDDARARRARYRRLRRR